MLKSIRARLPIILGMSAALMTSACSLNPHNWGLGATVGTTGLTTEVKTAVSSQVVLRGSIGTLPITRDETLDDVDYEAELNMTTVGGFVDFYPFHNNGFNVSGGLYGGDKSVDLIGVPGPGTSVEIGNTTYTGAQIGTLRGSVAYADAAPFVGIGYDGFQNHSQLWSFNARAGVMFVGKPDVTLTAEGGLASTQPSVQAELQNEAANLQDELDKYKYYPVVSVGVTRRF